LEPLNLAFGIFPNWIKVLFYIFFSVTIVISIVGVIARISIWAKGRDEDDIIKNIGTLGFLRLSFIKLFSKECILARRVFEESWTRGMMLLFIMWGIFFLLAATVVVTLDYILRLRLITIHSEIFPAYSLLLDLIGALAFIGVTYGLLRRCISKSTRAATSTEDWMVLLLLFFIILSGFISEGLRLAAWGSVSLKIGFLEEAPIGLALSYVFDAAFTSDVANLMKVLKLAMAFHLFLTGILIAYIPFSNLFHLFAAQITTSLSSNRYGGSYEEY
jgi:nitrate reductase gamma subunit